MPPKPDPDSDPDSVDLSFLPKHQVDELKKYYKPDFSKNPGFLKLLKEHKLADILLERRPAFHILASPLIEVVSVTLYKNLDDGTLSEVYGTIQVVDEQGAVFDIFKHASESRVSINSGEPLMLSMPRGRAITPSNFVRMEIALKEMIMKDGVYTGIDFVKESQMWDVMSNEKFDDIITTKVNGKRGFAVVLYVTYRHAVFVTLKMSLCKGEGGGSSSNRAHVYGSIVARCSDKYTTTLFNKKVNESVILEYGDDIELSKPVVIVPAWSSLVIDAKLWDTNRKEQIVVNPSEDFNPTYPGQFIKKIKGKNCIIKVELNWSHAQMQSDEETSDGKVPVAKKQRTEDFNFRLSDLRKALEQTVRLQMEVFSVSIHNTVDKEVDLWGSVEANYNIFRPSFLFLKEKTSSERLSCNQLLPIEFPAYCTGSLACSMELDLKDSYDRIISWGIVSWDSEQDFTRLKYWSDKKLCSVVPGDNESYAAVHYSIFNGGLQAAIRIQLKDKTSSIKHLEMSGVICCQYTGYDYSNDYDREYFRRKLFVRGVGDPPLVFADTDSNVLLCDSCVSVPRGSALVVEVDLNVPEGLKGELIFSTDDTVEQKGIDQPLYGIEVSVEWRSVPFVLPKDQK